MPMTTASAAAPASAEAAPEARWTLEQVETMLQAKEIQHRDYFTNSNADRNRGWKLTTAAVNLAHAVAYSESQVQSKFERIIRKWREYRRTAAGSLATQAIKDEEVALLIRFDPSLLEQDSGSAQALAPSPPPPTSRAGTSGAVTLTTATSSALAAQGPQGAELTHPVMHLRSPPFQGGRTPSAAAAAGDDEAAGARLEAAARELSASWIAASAHAGGREYLAAILNELREERTERRERDARLHAKLDAILGLLANRD
ncbi:hypothetical protein HK405_000764 [Cladochytrium tenue]|nr:hypothetical protein HK405_000764 [Cladochytrium tenue]